MFPFCGLTVDVIVTIRTVLIDLYINFTYKTKSN